MEKSSERIFKADWEPYVGPQNGKGWRNVDTDEVVYEDEPPGSVTLPDQIEDKYSLQTNFEIADVNEDDHILFSTEGQINADFATEVPANANVFGVLEEDDDGESQTVEPGQGYKPEFSNEDAEEVIQNNITMSLDSFETEFSDVDASAYQSALGARLTHPDTENIEEMSLSQFMASEIEGGFVPEFMIENILELVETNQQAQANESPEETYGQFDEEENIQSLPVGTTVRAFTSDDVVVGSIKENTNNIVIETVDGEDQSFTSFAINSAEAFGTEPPEEYAVEDILSENPSQDEIEEYAGVMLPEVEGRATTDDLSEAKKFVKDTFESDADGGMVYDELSNAGFDDYKMPKIAESIIKQKTAEFNDMDISAMKDYGQMEDINKRKKMYQEDMDETARAIETTKLMDTAASEWTGGSDNDETAVLWRLAQEMGQDNIPLTDSGGKLDAEAFDNVTDEEIEMAREYVEYTREALTELFGESFTLYRGQSGDYAREKVRQAEQSEQADADHRAIASWSVSPMAANKFAGRSGVMYKQEMPVEDMMLSMVTGVGLGGEAEIIAMGDRQVYDDIEPDDEGDGIIRKEELSDKEAFEMTFEQFREYLE